MIGIPKEQCISFLPNLLLENALWAGCVGTSRFGKVNILSYTPELL